MESQNAPIRKRQKRYTRSRGGCLTCKERKLKCDEGKPTCQRCAIESRECVGYNDSNYFQNARSSSSSSSLLSPSISSSTRRRPNIQAEENSESDSCLIQYVMNRVEQDMYRPALLQSRSDEREERSSTIIQPEINPFIEPHSFDSLLSTIWSEVLTDDTLIDCDWTNRQNLITSTTTSNLNSTTENSMLNSNEISNGTRTEARSFGETYTSSQSTNLSNKRTKSFKHLQSQLESMCTSNIQFKGIMHFFNHVAQCFHIIPIEANRWRTVFGSLSLQSDIIFRSVTAVGLVSLSHNKGINYRAMAYAHMSFTLRIWNQLVEDGRKNDWKDFKIENGKNALEILAVAILVGHIEQFDSGLANESNQCLTIAIDLILAILKVQNTSDCVIDTTIGSPFRFLTRILLWWDIFARTMGPGSGGCFKKIKEIISAVRAWEENGGDQDECVLDSTQCVTGWPLDLLEAIARTTEVEYELKLIQNQEIFSKFAKSLYSSNGVESDRDRISSNLEDLVSEARAVEFQIRGCRPKPVIQDSLAAAELRFILFELLQAGALIYFTRILSTDMQKVSKEIHLILRFLDSSVAILNAIPPDSCSKSNLNRQELNNENVLLASSDERQYYSRSRRQNSDWIKLMAPDGHIVWSYLQASIAANSEQQATCKVMLQRLCEVANCGAMDLFLQLLEDIWLRRRKFDESLNNVAGNQIQQSNLPPRNLLDGFFQDVINQRRWKQPLIF